MTKRFMCDQQLTQTQYAIQKNVQHLGNIILQLDDQRLTHISAAVARFLHYNGIGYKVHRILSTRLLPFEEISEEWYN